MLTTQLTPDEGLALTEMVKKTSDDVAGAMLEPRNTSITDAKKVRTFKLKKLRVKHHEDKHSTTR